MEEGTGSSLRLEALTQEKLKRKYSDLLDNRFTPAGQSVMYSWGRGEDGQLGNGDTNDQEVPCLIEALKHKPVVQAACGSGHTVVLTDDGEVWSWGRGDDGRLGHSDCSWKYVPRVVKALSGKRVKMVTCGSYHTAAVTEAGEVWAFGGGMYGKLGHGEELGHPTPCRVEALAGERVQSVACGSRHTVALTYSGEVYTWGDRENGVCGVGETEGHQYLPRLVEALKGRVMMQISACGFHTCVISSTGELFTWGEGKFGRLGLGGERNQTVPKLVETLMGKKIVQVACGGFHTACVGDHHEVYTFGGGEHGQLSHGDKTNRMVPCLVEALQGKRIIQVSCGWSHTVALSADGKVYTCGNGDHGKLGHGDTCKVTIARLVEPLAHLHVTKVASYNEHTVCLTEPDAAATTALLSLGFLRDLKGLVNAPDFSDVRFRCEGHVVHAHRAILAARSEHFRAMFRSGMRESWEAEIEIPPPTTYAIFLLLLEYLYTDLLPPEGVTPEMCVSLYMSADMYGIERLKSMCETMLQRGLNIDNAAVLLQHADDQKAHSLKEVCKAYVVKSFDVVSKSEGFGVLSRELILEVLQSR